MNRSILIGASLMTCLLAGGAGADTTIRFQPVGEGAAGEKEMALLIHEGRIAFQDTEEEIGDLIFDHEAGTATAIDHDKKTYTVLTAEVMAGVSGALLAAQAQMKAQMEALPPEQREQMRRAMGAMAPGAEAPEPVRIETKGKAKVDGRSCQIMEIYEGEHKRAELCVVNRAELGIPAEDYKTLLGLQDFLAELAAAMPTGELSGLELGLDDSGSEHFPVQITRFEEGEEVEQYRLSGVSHSAIAPETFAVPSGYLEQKVPF